MWWKMTVYSRQGCLCWTCAGDLRKHSEGFKWRRNATKTWTLQMYPLCERRTPERWVRTLRRFRYASPHYFSHPTGVRVKWCWETVLWHHSREGHEKTLICPFFTEQHLLSTGHLADTGESHERLRRRLTLACPLYWWSHSGLPMLVYAWVMV